MESSLRTKKHSPKRGHPWQEAGPLRSGSGAPTKASAAGLLHFPPSYPKAQKRAHHQPHHQHSGLLLRGGPCWATKATRSHGGLTPATTYISRCTVQNLNLHPRCQHTSPDHQVREENPTHRRGRSALQAFRRGRPGAQADEERVPATSQKAWGRQGGAPGGGAQGNSGTRCGRRRFREGTSVKTPQLTCSVLSPSVLQSYQTDANGTTPQAGTLREGQG